MSLMAILALATALSLGEPPTMTAADSACPVLKPDRIPAKGRKSPLDSLSFTVAKQTVKLCYGRPSSRGRVMLGGEAVPYGKLWRTGANEPTVFFTPVALTVAGVRGRLRLRECGTRGPRRRPPATGAAAPAPHSSHA